MRLILVRHGQTTCNIANIWHGWDHCELTEAGVAQAEAVAARLATEQLDAIYSSDIKRALQTAGVIAGKHGLQPTVDTGLRERNPGQLEGIPMAEVDARHPTIWEERSADYWSWTPPDGESFRQVLQRVLAVVQRLEAKHGDRTVVAVTHMGPVRVLISHFVGIPLAETYQTPFPSTGVSIFTLNGSGVQVEALNDDSHVS